MADCGKLNSQDLRFSQRWLRRVLSCSPLKVNRHFGGIFSLNIWGSKYNPSKKPAWSRRQARPTALRLLHGVTSQKIDLFKQRRVTVASNGITFILWRTDPLLGNDSLNTFPWEPTSATITRLLLGNGSVNTPKQYGTIEDGVFRRVRSEAI
jgi:hypothetical protein